MRRALAAGALMLAGALTLLAFPAAVEQRATAAAPVPDFDQRALLRHTTVLSSDEYEGRLPGTRGEELSVRYIADQFARAGLQPGSADRTYVQKVPLVGMTPDPSMTLTFTRGPTSRRLKYLDDVVAWTRREEASSAIQSSPLVFVGYGVQAPEYNWDDYRGTDVRGKTIVVLINDPPVPDPRDPNRLDPATFGGDAMTYYGRWTYKYDVAAQKGAAGVLIVHETGPAGYPWSVVRGFGGERFDLVAPNRNEDKAAIEGWITEARARELFVLAGQNFDLLHKRAATRAFRPVPLDATASIHVKNTLRRVDSRNVIGRLDGSDPNRKSEAVVYTAHWDHFGKTAEGVFHGAEDNASGVAGLIELARAFSHRRPAPPRSLLFLAVTGEEQNLLGSEYYVQHPTVPMAKTLADINLDMLNVHGRTADVTIVGLGKSDLDDDARRAAERQHRVVHGDLDPSKGYFYRSDHFPFAKKGVPGLYLHWERRQFVGRPAAYGREMAEAYTAHDYHKPTDVIRSDWDMSGAVEDLQLMWMVGNQVARAPAFPRW
ncbi:MAG: M20/M25/M40 family metallo-hydrolase, partial [Bacteroidales bacterium]